MIGAERGALDDDGTRKAPTRKPICQTVAKVADDATIQLAVRGAADNVRGGD